MMQAFRTQTRPSNRLNSRGAQHVGPRASRVRPRPAVATPVAVVTTGERAVAKMPSSHLESSQKALEQLKASAENRALQIPGARATGGGGSRRAAPPPRCTAPPRSSPHGSTLPALAAIPPAAVPNERPPFPL